MYLSLAALKATPMKHVNMSSTFTMVHTSGLLLAKEESRTLAQKFRSDIAIPTALTLDVVIW